MKRIKLNICFDRQDIEGFVFSASKEKNTFSRRIKTKYTKKQDEKQYYN